MEIMKYFIRSLKPASSSYNKSFASMKSDIKIYLEKYAFPSLLKKSPANIQITPAVQHKASEVQQTVTALKENKIAEANTRDDLNKKIDLLSKKICSST